MWHSFTFPHPLEAKQEEDEEVKWKQAQFHPLQTLGWDEGRSGRWGPVRRMEISVSLGALRRFYELLPFSVAAFTELGHTGFTGTLQTCGRWSSHKCT